MSQPVPTPHALAEALLKRRAANMLIAEETGSNTTIHVFGPDLHQLRKQAWEEFPDCRIEHHFQRPFRPRVLAQNDLLDLEDVQGCQDEPIMLGCQIQPCHGAWVGTAGMPVRYSAHGGPDRYCLLTCWHVAAGMEEQLCEALHQPTIGYPPIAYPFKCLQPRLDAVNLADAAIADTLHQGKHTIDSKILIVDEEPGLPADPKEDLHVLKVGRTTGLTYGVVVATGAAVRVSYLDGDRVFENQMVIEGTGEPFSAPGDSGSGVFDSALLAPVGLLFAGNDQLTIATPIKQISHWLSLQWPFLPQNQEQQP